MSAPNTLTSPEVGTTSPSSMAMVVVLPAPLPPRSATVVRGLSENLMWFTAVTVP